MCNMYADRWEQTEALTEVGDITPLHHHVGAQVACNNT